MEPNDYQIGGGHYKNDYQHWDLVCDIDMHYLLGCATKYISRWRKKNGIQDLRKALHYLNKAEEQGIYLIEKEEPIYIRIIEWFLGVNSTTTLGLWNRFCKDMELDDIRIMDAIFVGDYESAQFLISDIISEEEGNPTANYIDPDNNYFRG